jgi:Flp pilus assembly protein TadG
MYRQFRQELGRAGSLLSRFRRDEGGAVMMVAGLVMIPIFLAFGVAMDYSTASRLQSRLQAAADVAALSAAKGAGLTQSARNTLAQNMVKSNLPELTQAYDLTINEYDMGSNQYKVVASAQMPTAVMSLGGFSQIDVSVSSTALATTTTQSSGTTGNFCILAVSTSASPGILFNSGVTINASNCNIDIASTNGNGAATFNSNDTFDVKKICVAGSKVTNNDGTISALSTSCSVPADPFAGNVLPTVSVPSTPSGCSGANVNLSSGGISTVTAVYSGSGSSSTAFYCGANFNVNGATNATVQLQPGVYTGTWNFNSGSGSTTVVFEPGLYIFENVTWNMDAGWIMNGTGGVTFYFADTSYLQINSGVTVDLSAPSSGTYANILMFEAPSLSQSSFAWDGASQSSCGSTTGGYNLNGLVHLPSRNITFNSNVNVTSQSLYLVVNTAIYDNVTWNLSSSSLTLGGSGTTTTTVTNVSLSH